MQASLACLAAYLHGTDSPREGNGDGTFNKFASLIITINDPSEVELDYHGYEWRQFHRAIRSTG